MNRILHILIILSAAIIPCAGQGPLHKSFTISSEPNITIVNPRGSIRISGWDEARVEVEITSRNGQVEEGSIAFEQSGNRLVIDASRRGAKPTPGALSFEIRVPRSANLDSIITASGDVFIDGAGARVNTRTSSGNVQLLSIPGDIKVAATSGNVTVERAKGSVSVSATSGKVILKGAGSVVIEGRSDDVVVEDVKGDASISTSSGSIHAVEIGGRLRAITLSGGIVAKKVQGEARLNTLSEKISAEDIGGRLTASAISGEVLILGARGGVQASNVSGGIRIQNAAGAVEAQSTGGNLNLTGISSHEVKAACHSGNINFEGEVFDDGRYSFASFSGTVSLTLPRDSSFSFSGRTLSGQISSDFPLRDDPRQEDHDGRRSVSGFFGRDNAARIASSSVSGSIRVRMR